MIPRNIKREHILRALEYIKNHGFPKGRKSKKFLLELEGQHYPPKYAISLANKYVNGKELESEYFSGGKESNDFLRFLEFKILSISDSKKLTDTVLVESKKKVPPKSLHNERCKDCKDTISRMLEKIYGDVFQNYKINTGTTPDSFMNNPNYEALNIIYKELKSHRGYEHFVRAKTLPHCDFFIPDPGFVLEFDESQHFTKPREMALKKYPSYLKLGYDRYKWINRCASLKKKDNDPPFRDEQRAWYDTLRDFLPALIGINPTVRLFAGERKWCEMDPEKKADRKRFQGIIEAKIINDNIKVIKDPAPFIARIIISGEWDGDLGEARKLLERVCNNWPEGKKVNCLITCGAFLTFDWPENLDCIDDNIYPDKTILNTLTSMAEKKCRALMDRGMLEKISKTSKFMTIGIDSKKTKISFSSTPIPEAHAELVALLDLSTNQYKWTGKSYPTTGQEDGLIRFPDEACHFFDLSFGKTLILGCHDLNIFSLRGAAATKNKWRKITRTLFYKALKEFSPKVVLHHPHTTDSSRIWTAAWNEMVRIAPSVENYAGSGRYYRVGGTRSKIDDVLARTKRGDTIDFVIKT